jgi:lysophospholipase L1-like esterase
MQPFTFSAITWEWGKTIDFTRFPAFYPSPFGKSIIPPVPVIFMNSFARWLRVLGFALVTAMGLGSALAVEPPVRILPLGDSLTYGEALTSVQGGYRNRLYTVLTTAGYNVDFLGNESDTSNPTLPDTDHEGHPAYRIDEIQANIDGWLGTVEDPDVILLLIGTNDVWQDLNLAQAPTRLGNLIATIATKRPFAKIIVSNLPKRIDSAPFEAKQVTFNNALPGVVAQQVALGRQVTLLDMHSVLTPFDYSSDGVHPSSGGYVKMANAWAPEITDVIEPTGTANPPLIARTAPQVDLTHITVVFSKPVADDAVNLANFSLSGGLTVSNAVLDPATKRTVTLTTSAQSPGLVYTVSVSGVRDRTPEQNLIAPQSMVNFFAKPIVNGSFENGLTGWTVTNPDNLEVQSAAPYVPTDGSSLVSFNSGNTAPIGALAQTFPTTVGQAYSLAFDAGAFSTNNNDQIMRARVVGSGTLFSQNITITGPRNSNSRWLAQNFTFVANSSSATLSFTDLSTNTNSIDLLLDNVRVTPLATYHLAVTSSPASGAAMAVTPADNAGNAGGNSGLIRSYPQGASVTVTAPPVLAGGAFLMWRKNGVDLVGSLPVITVAMDANLALSAVYEPNNQPVAASDGYSTDEDTPLTVAPAGVLGNDSDDGPALSAVLVEDVQHGALTLQANGGFLYQPDADFHGADSFSYKVTDGALDSNTVTVTITVNPLEEFAQWLDENSLAAGPGDDSDGDSLSNAVEFVVGGNPANGPDAGLSPTVERVSADLDGNPGNEDYLLFSHRRTDRAHTDPSTAIKVEWATGLAGPWTDSALTPGVIVEELPAGAGVKLVHVYLPRVLQEDGRVFARLKVVVPSTP